jgi:GTP1/OBG
VALAPMMMVAVDPFRSVSRGSFVAVSSSQQLRQKLLSLPKSVWGANEAKTSTLGARARALSVIFFELGLFKKSVVMTCPSGKRADGLHTNQQNTRFFKKLHPTPSTMNQQAGRRRKRPSKADPAMDSRWNQSRSALCVLSMLSLFLPSVTSFSSGSSNLAFRLSTRLDRLNSDMDGNSAVISSLNCRKSTWLTSALTSTADAKKRAVKTSANDPKVSSKNIAMDDPEWSFFDTARIHVQGGNGGNGCVAFRREKGAPLGGPCGGRGGRGGSIFLQADETLNTLLSCRQIIHHRAPSGKNGIGKAKDGKSALDTVITVPVGTIVRELQTNKLAGELSYHGQQILVAKGGRGGRGNAVRS